MSGPASEEDDELIGQLVVARLVDDGRYDCQLRKVRRGYKERRDALLDALARAGLHERVEELRRATAVIADVLSDRGWSHPAGRSSLDM